MEWFEIPKDRYNGHKKTSCLGYALIYMPKHPKANKSGYIREHRWVMEKKMRRFLRADDIVHHINKDRKDNRLANLRVFKGHAEHNYSHTRIYSSNYTYKDDLRLLGSIKDI